MRFLFLLLLLSGCAFTQIPRMEPASFEELGAWREDNHNAALQAFRKSCGVKSVPVALGTFDFTSACEKAKHAHDARAFFETAFTAVKLATEEKGLLTGYIEMEVEGSRVPSAQYRYPLYKTPAGKKDYTRAEIDNGALKNQGLELLYLKNPADRFFLQVQGSGVVALQEGGVARVRYAGHNDHAYVAIGKYLKEQGLLIGEITMQTIRQWLNTQPESVALKVMQQNPRYIYFEESRTNATGAAGVELTPERSLAVDKSLLPYGLPVWLETTLPDGTSYHRLLIAQDTGAAIQGWQRGDIFFGRGVRAQTLAGAMQSQGRMVFLLPKE